MITLKTYDRTGEEVVGTYPTAALVERTVAELDWSGRHNVAGVIIERDANNWADGSGNTDPNTGFSLMLNDNGVEHVAVRAPEGLAEITAYLQAYLAGDMETVYSTLYQKPMNAADIAAQRTQGVKAQPMSIPPIFFILAALVLAGIVVALLV